MFITTPSISSMRDAFSVVGKNVVVTGGNRGIGRGIAEAFAQCGANVAIICRDGVNGGKACTELTRYGGTCECFPCDVTNRDEVNNISSSIFDSFGTVDVLVNNAGVATTAPFFSEKGLDEWYRVIDTNLHGTANVIYYITPKMIEAGKGGEIINISSVGGQRVSGSKDNHKPPYNASKAGIDIFTKYLAVVLGDYGIRVNSIAPGPFHTDLDKLHDPAYISTIEEKVPSHRYGNPIEVGALCVFLSSPAGAQITGAVYPLDGGLLCVI